MKRCASIGNCAGELSGCVGAESRNRGRADRSKDRPVREKRGPPQKAGPTKVRCKNGGDDEGVAEDASL